MSFPQITQDFIAETGLDFSFVVIHVEDWLRADGATGDDCALWDEEVGTAQQYPVLCEPTGTLGKEATTMWTGGIPNICVVDPEMTLIRCSPQGVDWALDLIREELSGQAG